MRDCGAAPADGSQDLRSPAFQSKGSLLVDVFGSLLFVTLLNKMNR